MDTIDKANAGLREQSKIFAKNSYLENTDSATNQNGKKKSLENPKMKSIKYINK